MPKQTTKAEVNTFVKGLITEASELNYPPNASVDEYNFELLSNGTRRRRLGMDLEDDYVLHDISASAELDPSHIGTFTWKAPGGKPDRTFLVVQSHLTIRIYDAEVASLTNDGLLHEFVFADDPVGVVYVNTYGLPTSKAMVFTSVDGYLIISADIPYLCILSFDGEDFSLTYGKLKTRDVWGIEAGEYTDDNTFRGDTLYFNQYYNLCNQSWGIPRKNKDGDLVSPVETYYNDLGKYPSNSEMVWTGLQYQPVTSGEPFERLYTNLFEDRFGAEGQAAKGHFIIDVIDRFSSRVDEFVAKRERYPELNLPTVIAENTDSSSGGSTAIAAYAGRVFYSGFSNSRLSVLNLSSYIFFSQLIKQKEDFFKCYQQGDPTSRDESDVVDTDGGFIRVAGADTILNMFTIGNSLIILASNGVWALTGGGDEGFTATNYRVDKISDSGCLGARAAVQTDNAVLFMAKEGIYLVSRDEVGGMKASNITETTIKSLYLDFDITSLAESIGLYDSIGNKARWLIQDKGKTTELILDMKLQAFSKHIIGTLSGSDIRALIPVEVSPYTAVAGEEDVYSLYDLVDTDGEPVTVSLSSRQPSLTSVRYLVGVTVSGIKKYTFGYYKEASFKDWKSYDSVGVDAKAVLLTGTQIAGDSSIQKQIQYLVMHFKRTENGFVSEQEPLNPSSCFGNIRWDFSNSPASFKYSALRQMYRYTKQYNYSGPGDDYDTGFGVITTKNLIRGRGKALALYLETEEGKDCHILGWSIAVDGNRKT